MAIYETYTPDGAERSRALLERLNALRAKHPEYPWSMVDCMAAGGRPGQLRTQPTAPLK